MLQEAKQLFRERTNREPAAFRAKITAIKKLLIELENTEDPEVTQVLT